MVFLFVYACVYSNYRIVQNLIASMCVCEAIFALVYYVAIWLLI